MPAVPSFGRLDAPPADDRAPAPEMPFRIAILGNFSGRPSGDLDARRPVAVTRETVDDAIARLKPSLQIPLPGGETADLTFASLDDFHPDALHDRVGAFDFADEDEKTALMRALLHHPDFQALESAWRGVDWMLRRVQKKDSGIEAVLHDVSRDELLADLTVAEDLSQCGLYRLLIEQGVRGPKGQPWSLLLGLYRFDRSPEHIDALGRMAKVAASAAAPFLADGPAEAFDPVAGPGAEVEAAWEALRDLPEAALLGLAVPRFLLRLPYGSNTKSIDKFDFEEQATPSRRPDPAAYLWGGAAVACGCLLGLGFLRESWGFRPGVVLDLDAMPLHVWRDEDGDEQSTLAEAWLTKPALEKVARLGMMALLCVRGRDALQLGRFRSLARPPRGVEASELVGRWGQDGAVKVPRGSPAVPKVAMGFTLMGGAPPPPPPPQKPSAAKPADRKSPGAPLAARPDDDSAAEAEDPELAALLAQLETGAEAAPAESAPAEEDPELAALLAQLEAGAEPAAPAPESPPAEENDPELAALLAQLETETAPEPAPEPSPAGTGEADPELAALLAQMESGAEPPPMPEPESDPELAALLAQLGDETATPPAPESPPTEEHDPELAALLAQLEGASVPEPAPAAPEPPAEEMDPELAALMAQLEGEPPTAEPDDLQGQIDALGGLAALEDLGWPTFARSFREDLPRQLRLLQGGIRNRAAEREVQELVARCGGLGAAGIAPDLGLGAQRQRLRAAWAAREEAELLEDAALLAAAKAYGARIAAQKTDAARAELLRQVRDHDRWANDPRNRTAAAALEGAPFAERRAVQLEQELAALGGDAAYRRQVGDDGATLPARVERLRDVLSAAEE